MRRIRKSSLSAGVRQRADLSKNLERYGVILVGLGALATWLTVSAVMTPSMVTIIFSILFCFLFGSASVGFAKLLRFSKKLKQNPSEFQNEKVPDPLVLGSSYRLFIFLFGLFGIYTAED